MANYIDKLKIIPSTVQTLRKAAEAMDNLAPLDTWRGNAYTEICDVLISLADAASIIANTLVGDLGDSSRISTNAYLSVLADSTASIVRFYTAAMRDAASATNPDVLKEYFGEAKDLDNSEQSSVHYALCSAINVYPELMSTLQNAEFQARRKDRTKTKEDYRRFALEAEKRIDDLTKDNRRLRKLISQAKTEPEIETK